MDGDFDGIVDEVVELDAFFGGDQFEAGHGVVMGRFCRIKGDDVTSGCDDCHEDLAVAVHFSSVCYCPKSTRRGVCKDVTFDEDWFTEVCPCKAPGDFSVDEKDDGSGPDGKFFFDDGFEL